MRSTVVQQLLDVHADDPRPERPGRRLLVVDPEDVGAVLHSNRFQRTDFVRQLSGAGLLATDGDLWRERRRIIQTSFPVRDPQAHVESIRFALPGFVSRLEEAADEERSVCLLDEMMRVVSRVVYRAVFGIELERDEDRVSIFQPMMEAVGDVHWSLVAPGGTVDAGSLARLRQTREKADVEIASMLQRRRAVDLGLDDALGRLIQACSEGQVDETAVHDEVRSLVLASTETSVNSLIWALLLLDGHPEVLSGIHRDLDAGDGDDAIDAVIWETLRLYPPVWANERQAIEPVFEAGRAWEQGDRAVISAYRLHRDGRLWDAPDEFRPERFAGLGDRSWRPPHRFAYMPFGAGPHLCIGRNLALLEMRMVMQEICRRFHLEFDAPDEVDPILGIVMRPSAPVLVRVHNRA